MLDLEALLRAASALDGTAEDVRAARSRLSRALAGTGWRSTAADRFAEQAHASGLRLELAADRLTGAARDLRRHHAAAEARQRELGAATEAVLGAGRAAAGAGVAAAAEAMAGARAAVERALAEAAEAAADARDALGRLT